MKPGYLLMCILLFLSFSKAEAAEQAVWSNVYLGYRPSNATNRIIQAYWAHLFNSSNIPVRANFHFTVFQGYAFPVKCKISSKKTYVYCQKSQNAIASDGLSSALYNTYDYVLTENKEEISFSMRNTRILKSGDFDDTTLNESDKFFLVLNFDSENKNKIHKLNTYFRKTIDQNDLDGHTFPTQSQINEDDDNTVYIFSKVAKEAAKVEASNIAGKTTKVVPICCYKTAAPNRCVNLLESSNLRMDRLSCFIIAANKFYTLKDRSEYHITMADYLLAREPLMGEEGNLTILQRSKLLFKRFHSIHNTNQIVSRVSNPLISGGLTSPEIKATALRGIFSFRNQLFRDAYFRKEILSFFKKINKDKAAEIKNIFQTWDRTLPGAKSGEERTLPASFAPLRDILETMLPAGQDNVGIWDPPYNTAFDTSDKLVDWLNNTQITFPFDENTLRHAP